MDVLAFWSTLTEPQAIIISGAMTIAAAVIGVVLGSRLFGGRINDLKGSFDQANQMLSETREGVARTAKELQIHIDQMEGTAKNFLVRIGEVSQTAGRILSDVDRIDNVSKTFSSRLLE